MGERCPGSSNIAPGSDISHIAPGSDIIFSISIFCCLISVFFVSNILIFLDFSSTSQGKFLPENTQRNLVFPNGILIIFVVLLCVLVCAWGDRSEG